MSAVPQRLSAALLFLLLAVCVYRARTQSLTVDEAWVFNSFVNQDLGAMGQHYDACNHVLHTLLMKASRWKLGTGELALRVPSLIGAALYFYAVYKLTLLVLGGWTQPLAVALLTTHPMLLDFMVAARGYGLGLGLLLLALYCAIVYHVRGFESRWLFRAGVLAGLSIAANLVFLFPAAALGLTLLLLGWRERAKGLWRVADRFGGPAIVTAFIVLIVPLLHAKSEDFYYGAVSLNEAIQSLVTAVIKVPNRWPGPQSGVWVPMLSMLLIPLCAAATIAGLIYAIGQYVRSRSTQYRLTPFVLTAGTLVFSAATVLLLHAAFGIKYPLGRTGLYFIPLFLLTALLALKLVGQASACAALQPRLSIAACAAGILVVVAFLAQTDNRYFAEWTYDAGTGKLLRKLHEDFARRVQPGQAPARLGTSQFIDQTVKYYRTRRNLNWMNPPETTKLESGQYDYYLLYGTDTALVDKLHLTVLDRDTVSGEVLARPAQ